MGIDEKWFKEWGGASNWAQANLYTKVTTFDKHIVYYKNIHSEPVEISSYLAEQFARAYLDFFPILNAIEQFFIKHIKK